MHLLFTRKSRIHNQDCDTFGPEPIWTHLLPHFLSPWTRSPYNWSSWTNGHHGQTVPQNLVSFWSPWIMVPNQCGPHISGFPLPVPLDNQNILGTICPGGPNWLGNICPWGPNFWGPFFHGDWIGWGPFVQRDQSIGDQLWGTKCPGTIFVWDQMCHCRYVAPGAELLWNSQFNTQVPKRVTYE